MNSQHVLVIDGRVNTVNLLPRGFLLSAQALHEYSTIVWLVDGLSMEMPGYAHSPIGFEHALANRLLTVQQWVKEGNNLIVVGPSATAIYHKVSSGVHVTGSVHAYFPMSLIQQTTTVGSKIATIAGAPTNAILDPFLKNMRYRSILAGKKLVPLALARRATAGEQIIVAGYLQEGKGKVFFVPDGRGQDDNSDTFFRAMAKLPACLAVSREDLPSWTSSFKSARENDISTRVSLLVNERQMIEEQIAEQNAQLVEEEALKHLISGTGEGFAMAVANALRELGFNVTDGPHPRADLIASCANRYIAIEAKGIDGSARERQYRQVERWMAELNNALHSEPDEIKGDPEIERYAECVNKVILSGYDGSDAKGLLIVGTFRQTPLNERADSDFPDSVVRLLQRTDTCGLTGVQLFGLVMAVRNNPDTKTIIQNEIIETRGLLLRCGDWQEFLSKVE